MTCLLYSLLPMTHTHLSSLSYLIYIFTIDLEWKVLYVGSAHDASKDQVLDEILVGPIPVGVNKFVLQADAPDPQQLPPDEILGVTVVLVTCSYRDREFIRVGYYVNNEYVDPNAPKPDPNHPPPVGDNGEPLPPPPPPKYPQLDLALVQRQILADKPRVTKFAIPWTEDEANKEAAEAQRQAAEAAGGMDLQNQPPPPAQQHAMMMMMKDMPQATTPSLDREFEGSSPSSPANHNTSTNGMDMVAAGGAVGSPMQMSPMKM